MFAFIIHYHPILDLNSVNFSHGHSGLTLGKLPPHAARKSGLKEKWAATCPIGADMKNWISSATTIGVKKHLVYEPQALAALQRKRAHDKILAADKRIKTEWKYLFIERKPSEDSFQKGKWYQNQEYCWLRTLLSVWESAEKENPCLKLLLFLENRSIISWYYL